MTVGDGQVLQYYMGDGFVGFRPVILCLREAVVGRRAHAVLAKGSDGAVRCGFTICRELFDATHCVRVAVRVAKRDSRLIEGGRVHRPRQGVLRYYVRFRAVFTYTNEGRFPVYRRRFYLVIVRVDVRVLFSLFTQRPHDPWYGIASALAFVERFVGEHLDQRLRVLFYLCMVDFRQRRSNCFKRMERRAHCLLRASSACFGVCVLRERHVTQCKVCPRSRSFFVPRVRIHMCARVFVRMGPIVVLIRVGSLRNGGQVLQGRYRDSSIPLAVSFRRETNVCPRRCTYFSFTIFMICRRFHVTITGLSNRDDDGERLQVLQSICCANA